MAAIFLAAVVPLMVTSQFADAHERGAAPPWEQLSIEIGMLLFSMALAEVLRRWFNFMLGNEDSLWRWQR
jgi:hypothetical protein